MPWPARAVGAEEAKHNFRGKSFDELRFRYSGPNADRYISSEDEGLRIHYPAGDLPKSPVGIVWNCRVRGDFVATARYEIVHAEPTPGGNGAELYLMLDNETKDGIPVSRIARTKEGSLFRTMHMTTDKAGKRISRAPQQAPAGRASNRGRIRVARTGGDILASLAEADEPDFNTMLTLKDIGTMDVTMVRFAGVCGGDPKAQLDLRLLEFDLQGELLGLPPRSVAAAPPAAPDDQPALSPTGSGRWVLWLLIVLGAITLAVFAAAAVLVRLSRAQAPAQPEAVMDSKKPQARLRLSCSGCGKSLKAPEDMAGKRVKCPGCGQTIQVPSAQ